MSRLDLQRHHSSFAQRKKNTRQPRLAGVFTTELCVADPKGSGQPDQNIHCIIAEMLN